MTTLLTASTPAVATESVKREMRGAWLTTLAGIDWPTYAPEEATAKANLITYLDSFKKHHFTAVFFQVRSQADALYISRVTLDDDSWTGEPWQQRMTGTRGGNPRWDPLAFVVEECHKRGLECYAWVNPLRFCNLSGGAVPDAFNTPFDTYMRSKKETLYNGETSPWLLHGNADATMITFNPGLSAVRKYVCDVVKDIVTNYSVDGIVFDDYFYPGGGSYEDYRADDWSLYQAEDYGANDIANWRRGYANQLVQEVHNAINEVAPGVRFGISPTGYGHAPAGTSKYPNVPTLSGYDDWAYSQIYCEPLAWLKAGTVDFVSPQIYWDSSFSDLSDWWSKAANIYGRHVYPSHNLYTDGLTGAQITNQVAYSRQYDLNNAPGCVMYRSCDLDGYAGGDGGHNTGIGDALETYFGGPSITPAVTWKGSNPDAPGSVTYDADAATLQWSAVDAGRNTKYAVYAVPASVSVSAASSAKYSGIKGNYLLGITYSNSYAIPAEAQGDYYYAVTTLNAYDRESIPAYYGLSSNTPVLSLSQSDWTVTAEAGEVRSLTVSINAQNVLNLTASIVGCDDALFSFDRYNYVAQQAIDYATTQSVTIYFTPRDVNEWTGDRSLVVSAVDESGNPYSATMTLKGTSTAPSLTLKEGWNYSTAAGTDVDALGWDYKKVRNMDYADGKLYLVYDHSVIKVIDAVKGDFLYDMNMEGVAGGVLPLVDVCCTIEGKVIASNISTATSETDDGLRIYVWDVEHPEVAPSVTIISHEAIQATGVDRIGDYVEADGNWSAGKLVFTRYDKVCELSITNGEIATGFSTKTIATTAPTSISGRAVPVTFYDSGTKGYYHANAGATPEKISEDGATRYDKMTSGLPSTYGNACREFPFAGRDYVMVHTYDGDITKGRMMMFDVTKGDDNVTVFPNPTLVGTYPAGGLGADKNGNATGNVIVRAAGSTYIGAWVQSTKQGIAFYYTGVVPKYDAKWETDAATGAAYWRAPDGELYVPVESDTHLPHSSKAFSDELLKHVLAHPDVKNNIKRINFMSGVAGPITLAADSTITVPTDPNYYLAVPKSVLDNVKKLEITKAFRVDAATTPGESNHFSFIGEVKGLEYLPGLTTLRIACDHDVEGDHEPDYTGNPYRSYPVNGFTSLDLSKNTELITLDLGYNAIHNIDLSANTKLRYLKLRGTAITTLDITAQPDLVYLDISQILGDENAEFTKLTANVNDNLEVLLMENCSYNNDMQADIIDKFKNLRTLDARACCFDALDVTQLRHLQSIFVMKSRWGSRQYPKGCWLPTLDLSQNHDLRDVHVQGMRLNSLKIASQHMGDEYLKKVVFDEYGDRTDIYGTSDMGCPLQTFDNYRTVSACVDKWVADDNNVGYRYYLRLTKSGAEDTPENIATQKLLSEQTGGYWIYNGATVTATRTATMADDGFEPERVTEWGTCSKTDRKTTGGDVFYYSFVNDAGSYEPLNGVAVETTDFYGDIVVIASGTASNTMTGVPAGLPTAVYYKYDTFDGAARSAKAASAPLRLTTVSTPDYIGDFYLLIDYPNLNSVVTRVADISAEGRQVMCVLYHNALGLTSDKPFEGVNIVETRYVDGSCQITKMLHRR
ncbi:MAG: family 10 glycosylhydrolase [Muribaculaceae bacterium]